MYQLQPTKIEIVDALEALKTIQRPYGDNEGDALNSDSVYLYLSEQDQEKVDHAVHLAKAYTRKDGNHSSGYSVQPNSRGITELNKAGFKTSLDPYQYDPEILVGKVEIDDERLLDIGDPSRERDDE